MRQANVSGKGAIFQVSDTKWIAKICLGVDGDGKPIIKQFSGKTEAIAKKKLRDFKKTADYAEKHLPSTDTVKAYFTAWMKDYRFHKSREMYIDTHTKKKARSPYWRTRKKYFFISSF